jgi:2'-5' RNA ligase
MSGDAIDRRTLRTFIAIDLPAPILRALATTQEQLQSYLRAQQGDAVLRWSPTKNLHLTLRFLGDTTPHQRQQVTTRLQAMAAASAPFTLDVDVSGRGLGAFPNLRQPRVVWSGVGGDLKKLGKVQAQTETIAQAVGFVSEEKSYSPHLTLARAAREADRRALAQVGQAIGNYAQSVTTPEIMSFEVDRLVFYQSELGAGGSRYTALAVLPFAGV